MKLIIVVLFAVLAVTCYAEEECKDHDKWCHYHIRYGACNFHQPTKDKCPMSCGLCQAPCVDKGINCKYDTRYGACNFHQPTKDNCQKSCGLCPTAPPATTVPTTEPAPIADDEECLDEKEYCKVKATSQGCKYSKLTAKHCKKSCGTC